MLALLGVFFALVAHFFDFCILSYLAFFCRFLSILDRFLGGFGRVLGSKIEAKSIKNGVKIEG